MSINNEIENLKWLRDMIIGRNIFFETPFGKRPLVYTDYTASGRALEPIESYLTYIMQFYANTHTEDDFTGKTMTNLLHQCEKSIKDLVNAGPSGKIIFTGTGATGAIVKLQQILGVYWPPATKHRMNQFLDTCENAHNGCSKHTNQHQDLIDTINLKKPIVFVSPYEHHSNELMWRQSLCEVVEAKLTPAGNLDLDHLESLVSDPKYSDRHKIGSFSAASNVSGIKTPVYEVAKILHKFSAIACFDFAASAPYVDINMNLDECSYFDAIFLSPHKFLGGPGSSGLLVFNERIYKKNLPPSVAAGGTVDYVTMDFEKFTDDIEEREKPGTPGILQALKASLAFDLKAKVGINQIEKIEEHFFNLFYDKFKTNSTMEIYGPTKAHEKVNIVSFNIKHKNRIIHPKLVTKLLNDLFGIQTRAGCSCAGPYGHLLLNIDREKSNQYICMIDDNRYGGLKPGWVRLNLHYSFSLMEVNYIISAIDFLIENANKFISLYEFNFHTGEWNYLNLKNKTHNDLSFDDILNKNLIKTTIDTELDINSYIESANIQIKGHKSEFHTFENEIEELMFFYVKHFIKKTLN